jgi:hypothetical protein
MVSVKVIVLLEKLIRTPARICLDFLPYNEAGEVAALARRFVRVTAETVLPRLRLEMSSEFTLACCVCSFYIIARVKL